MTDLPAPLRQSLASKGLESPGRVTEVLRSRDGTRKLLLELTAGGRVECVLIPMTDDAADPDNIELAATEDGERLDGTRRATLCVSTQIGCAMGCVFCASGQAGLGRGLGPEEIVFQVLAAARHLDSGESLRNLVFMGMGEPLHHYDQTARAIRLLTHPEGLNMSPRRITVSTVGLIPGIQKLGRDFDGKIGLAISLHAPNDAVRSEIMPMNRRYSFDALLDALREYPLPRRRRITIEYTLIAGLNDRPEHARELGRRLRNLRVKINLIPMNPIRASAHRAPPAERVDAFHDVLVAEGYSCFVRRRRGDDVDAACGQLALAEGLIRPRA